MAVPRFERAAVDAPGDAIARPHGNCYWLIPGRILAGEHPGAEGAAAIAPRVDGLLDAGIRQFIDLTEEGERIAPYDRTLHARAALHGIRATHHRFAIRDFDIPSAASMRTTLDAIYAAMDAGDPVYVHCRAGIGRTGTVAGCLLREQGLTGDEALAAIAGKWRSMDKRHAQARSPESPEQFAFIERWPVA